ncbi:MAG: flagellar protein FlgN [Pseudomonas sp.]|nr:flagellar protein FlgN [Pseudomonas sp.]
MSLDKHLARQSATVAQFIQLLEGEALLLAAGTVDGPRLSELAARKQAVLDEIERMESQRQYAQSRLGYGDDHQGAERAATDAGCLATWQQLLEQASRAQQLNRLNGESIRNRLEYNQRMLNFLHEAAGQGLYGSDGQARRGSLGSIASRA